MITNILTQSTHQVIRTVALFLFLATVLVVPAANGQDVTEIEVLGHVVTIEGDLDPFSASATVFEVSEGVAHLEIRLTAGSPENPPNFVVSWSMPSVNVSGHWTTRAYFNKTISPDWYPSKVRSQLARDSPVIALFGSDDSNRLTFAVSDALNPVNMTTSIREEDGRIYNRIELFDERQSPRTDYKVIVRFDARDVRYDRSLLDVSHWWTTLDGYAPAPVPEPALQPMYSTWYSYHQNVEYQPLIDEVKLASVAGFKAIIIDDGWQTLDSQRGYAFTGDWQPDRIPNMAEFVSEVHQNGLDVLLWYGLPLVGEKSTIFETFKGKYLRYWDGQGAYELDPRYPEVRSYLIDLLSKAMIEWKVDGFKLDFLGRFVANEDTEFTLQDGRDYASVNDATDRLMTDVISSLQKLNPDVMIEFRQPYIGPLMRKYGNMFRAGDAPNSLVANRVRATDLRLLSGNTAVHSDMLMWHPDESVESAALHFLNILFSVPQISVRFDTIPEEHIAMLVHYLDYWRDNQETLMGGAFSAISPLSNYPLIYSKTDEKIIACLYSEFVVDLSNLKTNQHADVLNAKLSEDVVVRLPSDTEQFEFSTFDATGQLSRSGTLEGSGVVSISVPPAGMVTLKRGND